MDVTDIQKGKKYLYDWGTGCFSKLIVFYIENDTVYGMIDGDEDENGKRRDCAGGLQMELNKIECDRYVLYEV